MFRAGGKGPVYTTGTQAGWKYSTCTSVHVPIPRQTQMFPGGVSHSYFQNHGILEDPTNLPFPLTPDNCSPRASTPILALTAWGLSWKDPARAQSWEQTMCPLPSRSHPCPWGTVGVVGTAYREVFILPSSTRAPEERKRPKPSWAGSSLAFTCLFAYFACLFYLF